MKNKLYVGGIPYKTTDADLQAYFAPAGTVVSAHIIIDKMTGRSKGFGFVEMSNDDEAAKACDMFHDKDYEGRTLTVNVARPLEPRENRAGGEAPRNRRSF
jgi:RNA recognition motif-containing protein